MKQNLGFSCRHFNEAMTDRAVSSKKDRRHRHHPQLMFYLEDLGKLLREYRIVILDGNSENHGRLQ
jgi:hypothetical protein